MSKITAFSTPEKVDRLWVINTTTYNKKNYEMVSAYWIIKQDNNIIRTNRYYFHKRL